MIYEGSRYSNTPLINYDGKYSFEKRRLVEFDLTDSELYLVKEGDTYDGLAHEFYNNSNLWWVLLDANKDLVPGFFEGLVPGTQLNIPSQRQVQEVLNKW